MKTVIHTATSLEYPEEISKTRVSFLINEKRISPIIAEMNLEMVKMKLKEPEEGLSWSEEQCDSAEIEYKRYLDLCFKFGKGIVPNKIMDSMWHYHILDTRSYHKDCENIYGGYMHHYPYFGMRGDNDAKDLENSFTKTTGMYLQLFGEKMTRDELSSCWHDCESKCWNACPSKE